MMSRRPVLSPGRVENYPPPLVRFLRSNSSSGGSRSRSRSRGRSLSSPLFVRRSKSSSAAAAAATQEPSSPKVTCMGQVRVRRSMQQPHATVSRPGSRENLKRRCDWTRNAAFCHPFAGKFKTRSFYGSCPKWKQLKFFNFRRKSNGKENNTSRSQASSRVDPDSVRENEREREDEEQEESFRNPRNANTFVSPATTPPINALLLTRSRSAPPYRSSSLAFRFWEADNNLETDEPNSRDENEEEQRGRNPRSEEESISINSGQDSKPGSGNDRKIQGVCELEKEDEVKSEKRGEDELELGFMRPPPMLTRCKSEPARVGERLLGEEG